MEGTDNKPKWNRRKEARPNEIIEAGLQVFMESGFAAAKLDKVAQRAGVAKGTLYRYYDTKEELFRAVVQHAITVHLQVIEQSAKAFQGSLEEFVPRLLQQAAARIRESQVPALAQLVISESRSFPDLARIWYEQVVARVLTLFTGLISEAQVRGEVRSGDPQVYAFSIVGPLVLAVLFQEQFHTVTNQVPDLNTLARQHAETIMRGLLMAPS